LLFYLGRKFFTKQTVFDAHLTGKKHLKAEKELVGKDLTHEEIEKVQEELNEKEAEKEKELGSLEFLVSSLIKELDDVWANTKANVEIKQSRTYEEREEDIEEEEFMELEEEKEEKQEDEEVKLYNPLKLPIGWDGKPIPYWLYKLHGLGVEYPCEICGNYVYMGRKAFEKHFTVRIRIQCKFRNGGTHII
jgi:splicing factor 3A subunit 3